MGKPGRPIGSMLAVALTACALLIAVPCSLAQAKPCNHTKAAENTAALQHASRRLSMEEPPECTDVFTSKAVLSDPDRNVLKQACELTWKTGSKENINCRNVYRTDQGIVAGICNTPGSFKPDECHRLVNAARMVYQGYVQICGEKTVGSQLGAALGVFQTKGPPGGAGCFKLRPLAAQTSEAICKDTWPGKDFAFFHTDCMKQAATPDVKAVGDFLCASSAVADMPVCQNAVTAVKLVFHGWAQMCVHRPFVLGPFFKANAKQLASYTPPQMPGAAIKSDPTTATGPTTMSSKPGATTSTDPTSSKPSTTSTQPTRPAGGSGPTGGGGGGATTAPQPKHFEGPVYPEYLGQSRFEDDEDDSSEQHQYHRSKYQDTIDDNDNSRSRYESDGDDDTDGPSLARSRYEGSGDSDGITAGRSRYESSSDSDDDMIPSQSRYETNDDSDDDISPSQSRYESSSADEEEAPSRSRFDEDYEVPKTRPHRARYGIVDEEDDNDRK